MNIRKAILSYLVTHPNTDTRLITTIFSQRFNRPKQAIAGHLSWLLRTSQISIITHTVGVYSTAS